MKAEDPAKIYLLPNLIDGGQFDLRLSSPF